MPDDFKVRLFDESCLPLVESLNCGSNEFGEAANAWIRCIDNYDNALTSIRDRDTQVFLYFVPEQSPVVDSGLYEDDLCGFGSLGLTTRTIRGERIPFSCIPHLGLDYRYHGRPHGVPFEDRYSSRLLGDLISRAQDLPPEELLLFVDVNNVRARKLYDAFGFEPLGKANTQGLQPMVLQLPRSAGGPATA